MAFPNKDFTGTVAVLGATVDPNTHTTVVRTEVRDAAHELRPGMLATYVIRTGEPVAAPAVPLPAVVREGDGTMSVWTTIDNRHFLRRTVKIGLQQDGFDQVVDGLNPGERIITNGAVFIGNMANAATSGS
jgi:cobalt-zinc-cadmium efflux system membrane fusion protein